MWHWLKHTWTKWIEHDKYKMKEQHLTIEIGILMTRECAVCGLKQYKQIKTGGRQW